jgi:hypothetical protein
LAFDRRKWKGDTHRFIDRWQRPNDDLRGQRLRIAARLR